MDSLRLIAQPLANLLVPSDIRPKTHFASRLCTALFLSLLTFPLLASLAEAQDPNPRDSAAIAIAARRLNVPENELTVVNDVQLGKYFSIKVAHLSTGRVAIVYLNSDNRPVPPKRLEQVLSTRSRAGFIGKQERALVNRVAQRPSTERTTVVVWTRPSGPSPRLARTGSPVALSVSAQMLEDFHKSATQKLVEDARLQGWALMYQAKNAPVAVLRVPNDQIQTLEARSDVEALYIGREYHPQLNISAKAIDADRIWPTGYIGGGVKIAVVELPDTTTSTTAKGSGIYFGHSNLLDGIYCNPSASPLLGQHATNVAGIIASNNTTYKGIAHGAPALLSGNTANTSDAEIMKCTEWAIGQGANLINYSFGSATTTGALSGLDQYADYIARNYSVTIVAAAGNSPTAPQSPVMSPGKGYNVLTVGNYDDRNTVPNSDDVMSPSSRYGDPASLNGDRKKPEVAAPGVSIYSTCVGSTTCFGADSGTSLSAPHVTGCAALLMSASSILKTWPETVRAILMASAVTNIEGDPTLSEKDGVGGIECDSAYNILSGYEGGEWHGPVTSTSFPQDITFNATVGETARVVITWDSNPDPYVAGTTQIWDPLQADLDLTVLDPSGTEVGRSDSWDNSYEIVEFPVFTTGVYTVRVSASRFEGFSEYLGVAWWQGFRERD